MELAKDEQILPSSFYGSMLEATPSLHFPKICSYGFEDSDGLESPSSNNMMNNSPPLSSSSSANSSSNGFVIHPHPHQASNYQPHHEEAHSLINFKPGYESFGGGSLLSFQQDDQANNNTNVYLNEQHQYPLWEEGSSSSIRNDHHFKIMKNIGSNVKLLEELNSLQTSSVGGYQDKANEWLYSEAIIDPPHEFGTQQTCFHKRPHMEEENKQASKKQCTDNASKKSTKPKSSIAKDPQSIAAKNRRERISERLKILQDLVPNGSKVDLVTMLEKAIGYVKFLQLQVKVLATDEFWPAAGGKAPDINQVREAIDAILSSQRSERTTSSK